MSEALSYAALCKMVELFHVWFVLSMNTRVYWGGGEEPGWVSGSSNGLQIRGSWVQSLLGAVGEFSSAELTSCSDYY